MPLAYDAVLEGFAVHIAQLDLQKSHAGVGVLANAHFVPDVFAADVVFQAGSFWGVEVQVVVDRRDLILDGKDTVLAQLLDEVLPAMTPAPRTWSRSDPSAPRRQWPPAQGGFGSEEVDEAEETNRRFDVVPGGAAVKVQRSLRRKVRCIAESNLRFEFQIVYFKHDVGAEKRRDLRPANG